MSHINQAEEGRITVCVRARPLSEREKRLKSPSCLRFHDGKTVRIFRTGCPEDGAEGTDEASTAKVFAFDRAYDSNVVQASLYEDLGLPVLASSFKGFNTCIFAYGQTGSGKSYSMMGPSGGRDVFVDPGIIPRLSKGLFAMVQERHAKNANDREAARANAVEEHALPPELNITVLVSYMEIYQERVNCLLNNKLDNLKVREHPALGVYVEKLSEVKVFSENDIMQVVDRGNQGRHTAATKMNDRSSRSHAIFSISLIQEHKSVTKDGNASSTALRAKINLVDLAGSERAKSTGAEGDTLREGANINRSLTVLGQVINALAQLSKQKSDAAGPKHVPYRDSTLTFILKESLGGNSKTFMLSTLSPAAANYEETLSTLRYADRAKAIVTRAIINESAGDRKIRELEDEVRVLREKMRHYEEMVAHGEAVSNISNRVSQESTNDAGDDGETRTIVEDDMIYAHAKTPRWAGDAAALERELRRSESLIQHLVANKGISLEASTLRDMYPSTPTIRVNRNEPFLLNMDGVGDWVVEYLFPGTTYFGREAGDTEKGARCIVVSGEQTAGIAARHCCFIRQEGGEVLLRPLDGNLTYIDDDQDPVAEDTPLKGGTVVCLGDEYVQFKFFDPTAPQPTARRRNVRNTESPTNNALSPSVKKSSLNNQCLKSSVSDGAGSGNVGHPTVPALRLKEALQRDRSCGTRIKNAHHDPMTPTMSSTTTEPGGVSMVGITPRTTRATGRVVISPNDELRVMYRHTFLFIGASNAGKSAFRENLQKPDKWYSMFANEKLHVRPTFGVDSSLIETAAGKQSVQMNLMELSGDRCFSLVEGLLPTRRVTYVLCFSLQKIPSLETLQPLLEFILCRTSSRDATVVLIGTYLDTFSLEEEELGQVFATIEMEINNYFRLVQDIPEKRPSIVGRFAVDNISRVVVSPGFSKMKKFPELLCWFGEQVLQRCRNDVEFPNAEVPLRALALSKKIRELTRGGQWYLTSASYKAIAKAVDARYGLSRDDLHRHTQLLVSWGVLHHHFRHFLMKKYVMVDVQWVYRVVAVLSCCTPSVSFGVEPSTLWKPLPFVRCQTLLEKMRDVIPFDVDAVLASDVYSVFNRGVLSVKTAMLLFRGVMAEKGLDFCSLTGLLEVLRIYDFVVMGSRLKFSSFMGDLTENVPGRSRDVTLKKETNYVENGTMKHAAEDKEEDKQTTPAAQTSSMEMFLLIPACFNSQPPSAFNVHLPSFLCGPFYRFTLNIVPHNFFACVTSRVAHLSEKIYLGPVSARPVPVEDLVGGDCNGITITGSIHNTFGDKKVQKGGARAVGISTEGKPMGMTSMVDKSHFWESTAWVISSARSRALIRMVQHSLLITFHDFDDDEEFYDGLLRVVRNLVFESPGVQCEESILCSLDFMDEGEKANEVHGDRVYWRGVDDNLNSLEKIRQREQLALMTARSTTSCIRPDDPAPQNTAQDMMQEEEGAILIPFVRNRKEPIDVEASMRRVCEDSLLTNEVLNGVSEALHEMNSARRRGSGAGQCEAMDRLVDLLAQA
ncbi:putative Unc104-like kinesin [Trypanosoma rangeli]|uniref:Putative Unc104-like kinesin n=1 Tax=Trypanosoma rangeli TaxID=5698 RepID=A0A3R7NSW8_TRYRA|nr:putative Unc104-like kinesin [Trypanosoma rangeli]RNF11099.1 putative Unc104-like kinesin [Trypanosoma rangeli]|eukprot:RNF11099.1 putative Unc104-like kinesin [Trypanosoma rangeli]